MKYDFDTIVPRRGTNAYKWDSSPEEDVLPMWVADLVKLKYKNSVDGEICFLRQKTERTTKTIKEIRAIVTPEMQAIIDRWGTMT